MGPVLQDPQRMSDLVGLWGCGTWRTPTAKKKNKKIEFPFRWRLNMGVLMPALAAAGIYLDFVY